MTLENYFHETLFEFYDGGLCPFCMKNRWTELAHDIAQSVTNISIAGDMIDAPIINVMPSCHPCNMDYKRNAIMMALDPLTFSRIVYAGKESWVRYFNNKSKRC